MKRYLLIIALLLLAPMLCAQEAQPHRGFWIGFGLGGGRDLNSALDGTQRTGGTGYLRLGGTPSQKVLLGFEGFSWTRGGLNRSNAAGTVIFYPSSQGFFLKGGLGLATIGRTGTSGNTSSTTNVEGFGVTTGLGYEMKIGRNIYLVPGFDVLNQFFSAQTDPVLGNIPGHNSIVAVTVGLLWH